MNSAQMEELADRIDKLEKRDIEEFLTILEIMSNVTFFGEIKKSNCKHAKHGQCSLFHLECTANKKIPIATECRIPECDANHDHCHLETNNVTCTLCAQWKNNQNPAELQDKQRR